MNQQTIFFLRIVEEAIQASMTNEKESGRPICLRHAVAALHRLKSARTR